MARRYNFIYDSLVSGENDVVGHVAYALYKADKKQFIEQFKEQHDGEEPTEDELFTFHGFANMNKNRYLDQAVLIVKSFLSDTLEGASEQIEEDCRDRHKDMLREVVSEMKPKPFWYGVAQSVLGAFAFMLLCCLLIFFLNFSDNQYTFTFGGSGSAKVEQTKYPPPLLRNIKADPSKGKMGLYITPDT